MRCSDWSLEFQEGEYKAGEAARREGLPRLSHATKRRQCDEEILDINDHFSRHNQRETYY
ncbi:hypothetical protein E2C01_032567 [Portunus trituberculatus]|uniref:Uncharacterized protein n=1 Tax=Portunus trituberculatus TaxID=210409 RepID=A0A5B7F1A1_PORTR|nr:hypothetical protein [Portunus trituberculatus]